MDISAESHQNVENYFSPIRAAISEVFLPKLFGCDINDAELNLFCRPARYGGLGVHDPIKTSPYQFSISKNSTSYLSNAISKGSDFDLDIHEQTIRNAINIKKEQEKYWEKDTNDLLESFPESQKRCISRKLNQKCSGWLSIIPLEGNNFDLSPTEFRDALALGYGLQPVDLSSKCDADGEDFDLNHALNCPKGGLVYGRHNEL